MTERICSGVLQDIGPVPGEVNLHVHPPCLICGQFLLGIKAEVVEVFGTDSKNLRSASSLLQFLIKLFQIKEQKANKFWNLNDEDEPDQEMSFCHLCKQRLEMLMELERKLNELSEQLQNGRDELKKCLERSEESLEKEGIYESDKRYYRIRRQILGRKFKEKRKGISIKRRLDTTPPVEVKDEQRPPPTRTSSRAAAKKANERLVEIDFKDEPITTPFVLLSKADRKCAEGWKREFSCDRDEGKHQNQRDMNDEGIIAATVPGSDQEYDECPDFDFNSSISSDPDSDFVVEPKRKPQRPKKVTKVTSHKKSENGGGGGGAGTPKRSRKEVPINSITSERNFPNPDENYSHDSPIASSTRKRKSRIETKIRQDEDEDLDFIPEDAEDSANDKASSDSEEELNSDDLESDTEERTSKKRATKRYKYHIDKSTGDCTFLNILLQKLPNNELGRQCYKCTLCSKIVEIRGKYMKDYIRQHVIATHGKKSKKAYNKHHIDTTTGNITYINVTLEKLSTNPEFGKEQYQCELCSQILVHVGGSRSLDKLKRHIVEKHTDFSERYKCLQCERKFRSSTSLLCHVQSAHEKSIAHCPICGKPFTYLTAVTRHRKSHLGEEEKLQLKKKKNYSPRVSGTEQQPSSSLQCEHCGRICSSRKQMQDHYLRRHGTEEEKAKLKAHLCPECGKYVSNLKSHTERAHSTFRNYPCVLCDKRFKTARCLISHKRAIHGKVAPFKCTLCTKSFFTKYTLDSHTKVHLNIREFQCEHCPIAFTRSAHLQRHNRIYHEEGSKPKRGTFIRGIKKKGVVLTKSESPIENYDQSSSVCISIST